MTAASTAAPASARTPAAERLTSDPLDPATLRAEVARVLDAIGAGGVAIVPLDVAYAILARSAEGIRRIFAAKGRSWNKPSGLFGSIELSRALHILPAEKHALAETIIETEGLPFSIVAPYRADHPLLASVDPFVLANSTKGPTLDMLLNAGQFHNAMAAESLRRGMVVFGSSANRSLTGSRYRLAEIDAEVRQAADVAVDHGLCRYANAEGRSSTIIDFADWSVLRKGVCFEALAGAFRKHGGITLADPEAAHAAP